MGQEKQRKKNNPEIIKQELLVSPAEHSDGEGDYSEFNEDVKKK